MKPSKPADADKLRRRTEYRLQSHSASAQLGHSEAQNLRLLHELQVHQIELEMQNEELRNARAQLEAELARFTDFYDFAPVGYFTLDPSGAIALTNTAGARLLGSERAKLQDKRFALFVAEADRPAFNAFLKQVFAAQAKPSCEVTLASRDRIARTVLLEATLSPDGMECRAVAVDISAHKQTENRLQLAASVFAHAREGILIADAQGTLIEVNDAFTEITGYSREEALNQNRPMLQSGRQSPAFYTELWRHLASIGHWRGEMWNRRKSGEVYAEMVTISAVRDAGGKIQNYIAVCTDITPMKEHQRQLEHIAHFDPLTKLPNRVLLADRLQQAMLLSQRRNTSVAVVYLDLDGFKAVNDQQGHDVGDQLLVALAQRMKAALRDQDTLARIGGDEFVAVLADLERAKDCEPVLARVLRAASEPVPLGSALLQVCASMGVTVYPQDGSEADGLLRHADQAMYGAKQAGKNRYHMFDVVRDAAVKSQRESLEHIRRAIERREFVLHYQPKVNMKTGAVIGAEALIRWQHPKRGLLLPADFLPLIEDHPISVDVGEWVINTALSQMREWKTAGLDIPVSVNVSAHQLQQDDFTARLRDLLAIYPDIPPGRLELEILETTVLQDTAQISDLMLACSQLGVRFALDDFGTGYSSLTYLKRLPAHTLKIDQSFVCGMLDDPDDLAIVKGVIGLAAAFRREVIAEGVETITHGALLLSLGCELAQGFGIARPMPAQALPGWAASWKPDEAWTA
jgi:diguanylate cyclase (GGDEF)-like protein/PAS domain S-box-containing protein